MDSDKQCPRVFTFKNLESGDWRHRNDYCKFDWRVYNTELDGFDRCYLFEMSIIKEIYENEFFSDYDRNQMLNN
jgi:hypothetical protein